jgi:hypothetical protein
MKYLISILGYLLTAIAVISFATIVYDNFKFTVMI